MKNMMKIMYDIISTLNSSIQAQKNKGGGRFSLCIKKEGLHVTNASKGKTLYLSESFGQSKGVRNFSPLNLRRKDTGDYVSATGICG